MATLTLDPSLNLHINRDSQHHNKVVVNEIDGLIKVFKDGQVERFPVVPCVKSALAPNLGVTSCDIVIDKVTNIWARFYLPQNHHNIPLLIYFHGGGFCVGSADWSCYHEFLARLSGNSKVVIISVNYRLAPENILPAAYDDGVKVIMWLKQQAISKNWWSSQCNFSKVFLGGDSAGANIAYNVGIRLEGVSLGKLGLIGNILIQPFFGGEERTNSEKYTTQTSRSVLSLATSDAYWRMSLPKGSNRDHKWCNPMGKGSKIGVLPCMVCVSELDILKDRNLEFCRVLGRAGKKVEYVIYKGVGHAFHILDKSQVSQTCTNEMISHIKAFISSR